MISCLEEYWALTRVDVADESKQQKEKGGSEEPGYSPNEVYAGVLQEQEEKGGSFEGCKTVDSDK